MSKITKPATPKSLLAIIVRMVEADGPVTAKQIDTNSIYMGRLEALELVKVKATVKHTDADGNAGRGRPSNIYALTAKGRGRAKRAAAKS